MMAIQMNKSVKVKAGKFKGVIGSIDGIHNGEDGVRYDVKISGVVDGAEVNETVNLDDSSLEAVD